MCAYHCKNFITVDSKFPHISPFFWFFQENLQKFVDNLINIETSETNDDLMDSSLCSLLNEILQVLYFII